MRGAKPLFLDAGEDFTMNREFAMVAFFFVCFAFLLQAGFSHAHDEEEKRARMIFNDAKLAIYDGKVSQGRGLLESIITDYKGTMTATDAIVAMKELQLAEEQSRDMRLKAKKSQLQADIRNAKTLMEVFFADNTSYPDTLAQLRTAGTVTLADENKLYIQVVRNKDEKYNSGYRLILFNENLGIGLTAANDSFELVQIDRGKLLSLLSTANVVEKSENVVFLK
jgi:hypothetical protein